MTKNTIIIELFKGTKANSVVRVFKLEVNLCVFINTMKWYMHAWVCVHQLKRSIKPYINPSLNNYVNAFSYMKIYITSLMHTIYIRETVVIL